MARGGGFGGSSLTPFGTIGGGFSQYDIGADLADLEVYRVEVAWGNGLATDAEYLEALEKAVTATDPDTQRRESAVNKRDDAVYRIGRSKAEEQGLDQLIAYDQAALAKMKPENVRYRDVQQSLRSELAQRRSRDYGKLVDAYNAGKSTTQSLLSWVKANTGALTQDDPDYESWKDVNAQLTERIRDEKDAKVYQDYQQNRLSGAAFLKYLTGRRDAYDRDSPQFADWDRKLEDARDNVRDKEQAKKDTAFFNRYELGKVSDKAYLTYIRKRIAGMERGDPAKAEWQHRLKQASFSLAEDKLRFDVQRGAAPVGRLISFYRNYQRTLNPGSAEYRQIARALMSLGAGGGGGGGGSGRRGGSGGRSSGRSGGSNGTPSGKAASSAIGKMISPRYTLESIVPLFAIDPTANRSAISGAKKYLDLNMQNLGNAVRAGDGIWLFQDPRKPGAVVAGRHPDGSPMLDSKGKPIMVRGSAYLPASGEAFANLKTQESRNWSAAAEYALARRKTNDYAYFLRRSAEALDQARQQDAMGREQDWEDWYRQVDQAVDRLTQMGDYGAAVELGTDLLNRLAAEAQNPYLDRTRRERLDSLGARIENNPVMPKVIVDPFDPTKRTLQEGAVSMADLANGRVTLNPGWHHVLRADSRGRPAYGPVFDPRQDGSWEQNHVTVHTSMGGKVVTGEVRKSSAPVAPKVLVNTPTGRRYIDFGGSADYITFPDENGRMVRAFSLDGRNWIVPAAGMPNPTVEISGNLRERTSATGKEIYDPDTGKVVFKEGDRGWEPADGFDPNAIDWMGAGAYNAARSQLKPNYDRTDREQSRLVQFERDRVGRMELGGEGVHMMYVTVSPSGIVNLTPSQYEFELRSSGLDMEDRRARQLTQGGPTRAEKDDFRPFMNQSVSRFQKDDVYRGLPADTPPRFEGSQLGSYSKPALPVIRHMASAYKDDRIAPPKAIVRKAPTGPSLSRVKAVAPPRPKQNVALRKTTPPKPKPTPRRPAQKAPSKGAPRRSTARRPTPKPPIRPINASTMRYMSNAEKV